MNKNGLIICTLLCFALFISCKDKNNVETGTEFPQEFLGVWEADTTEDPDAAGIFINFEKGSVTFYGRVGEDTDFLCYIVSPLFEIVEYKGNLFTLRSLDGEEESLAELTIEVDGSVMEWIITKNDVDRWIKSDEDSASFTPECDIDFKEIKNKAWPSVINKYKAHEE